MSDANPVFVEPKMEIDDDSGEIGADGDGREIVPYFPKIVPETTKSNKPRKHPRKHPRFLRMAVEAIKALQTGGGDALYQDIFKYVMANFEVGDDAMSVDKRLKDALGTGLKNSMLIRSNSGGFCLSPPVKKMPQAQSSAVNLQETNSKYKVFGGYVAMALAQMPPELANTKITEIQNLIQRAQAGTTEKD